MSRRLVASSFVFVALVLSSCSSEPPAPKPGQRRAVIVFAPETGPWQVALDRWTDPKGIDILYDEGVAEEASKLFKTKGVKAVVVLNCTKTYGAYEHARWYTETAAGPQTSAKGFDEGLEPFLISQGLHEKRKGIEPPPPPPQ